MTNIIFLDKDRTLGNFLKDECGLYPNVNDFLELQKQKERKLYVVTTAGDAGRKHLVDISDKLDGYFGYQQINSIYLLYVLPDGRIRKVHDDYIERIYFESEERKKELFDESEARTERLYKLSHKSEDKETLQKEINALSVYWRQLFHKETREPFDASNLYNNSNGKFFKDLYLARRLISPLDYESLRTVMVGDNGDITTVLSNLQTPLIVISNTVREGNWQIVAKMLDKLFSDESSMPWEVYENLFYQSTSRKDGNNNFHLNDIKFTIKKGEHNERIIYCP